MRKGLTALAVAVALLQAPAVGAQQLCDDFSSIAKGSYEIVNNIWDRAGFPGKQCITGSGWTWDWPANSTSVRSYPSIRQGWQPWTGRSTVASLPVQVSAIQSVTASFSVKTTQSGQNNTAFEMWITRSNRPSPQSIKTEIMIWTARNGMNPAGAPVGTVSVDGRAYELWHRVSHNGWRYVAFVAQRRQTSGTLRLDSFIAECVKRGYVAPSDYLADIEFGNEIINGKGTTVIGKMTFSVK